MKDRALIALIFLCMLASLLGYAVFQNGGEFPVSAVPRPPEAVQTEALEGLPGFSFTPVIDPGHGGLDGGAVSPAGRYESEINLEISLKTDLILRFLGLRPVMTRETDISLHDPSAVSIRDKKNSDLHNRAAMVNKVENAVLVSIHQNLFPQRQYSGAQVFHNGEEDNLAFAEFMQEQLRLSVDPSNNRKAKKTDAYLMARAQCPAILIECGFLSNPAEEALLQDPAYQTKFALAVCGGLMAWEKTRED